MNEELDKLEPEPIEHACPDCGQRCLCEPGSNDEGDCQHECELKGPDDE